jgi:hypothetical protein
MCRAFCVDPEYQAKQNLVLHITLNSQTCSTSFTATNVVGKPSMILRRYAIMTNSYGLGVERCQVLKLAPKGNKIYLVIAQ